MFTKQKIAMKLVPAVNKVQSPVLVAGISMHHIYCDRKKGFIVDRAQELCLGGFYLFGKPGRVVVEGDHNKVLRYERDLRCLRWQKIQVMGRIEAMKRCLEQSEGLIECNDEADLIAQLNNCKLQAIVAALQRPFGAPRSF